MICLQASDYTTTAMSSIHPPALETLMLALRECSAPTRRPTLFLGALPHPQLEVHSDLLGWQPLQPAASRWDQSGAARCDELPARRWSRILLLPGKSRSEILSSIATASKLLEPNGELWTALANDVGAARYEKEVVKACGPVVSVQKHKCRAFLIRPSDDQDVETLEHWRALGEPHPIADGHLITRAGVFSEDGIDPGSALLAQHLPRNLRGKIADLGAGWGFLSATALENSPHINAIDLYEADARALQCARTNLAGSLGQRSARFLWHDVTQGCLENDYDAILMNPPFHTGRATDVALGVGFIKSAAQALRRGGSLWMVANRQLPYEEVLNACGFAARNLAEDSVYKVFHATKRC